MSFAERMAADAARAGLAGSGGAAGMPFQTKGKGFNAGAFHGTYFQRHPRMRRTSLEYLIKNTAFFWGFFEKSAPNFGEIKLFAPFDSSFILFLLRVGFSMNDAIMHNQKGAQLTLPLPYYGGFPNGPNMQHTPSASGYVTQGVAKGSWMVPGEGVWSQASTPSFSDPRLNSQTGSDDRANFNLAARFAGDLSVASSSGSRSGGVIKGGRKKPAFIVGSRVEKAKKNFPTPGVRAVEAKKLRSEANPFRAKARDNLSRLTEVGRPEGGSENLQLGGASSSTDATDPSALAALEAKPSPE